MSCSINRYANITACTKTPDAAVVKEMNARMKEMLEIRAAQDGGDFKTRPSWDPVVTKPTPAPLIEHTGPVLFNDPDCKTLNRNKSKDA